MVRLKGRGGDKAPPKPGMDRPGGLSYAALGSLGSGWAGEMLDTGPLGFGAVFRAAHDQQVVEGALVHDMEAGFVAAEVGELRSGGEFPVAYLVT